MNLSDRAHKKILSHKGVIKMKVSNRILSIFIIGIMLLLSGCATNRSVLNLSLPETGAEAPQNGGKVFIASVLDQRVFQENPKTQDIPSLGFGGAENAADELKKRAVGRKRNSYGKALGDILLDENQSVETVIKNALEKAFISAGYNVIEDKKSIDSNTITVNVSIEKFWAYMTPGFWTITLTSDISTDLTLTSIKINGPNVEKVSVKSEGNYQAATESNWKKIIDQSLSQYVDKTMEILSARQNK